MKFLLELVSCCSSSSSSDQRRPVSSPKEERRLLVGHVPASRHRDNSVFRGVKRGRYYGRCSSVAGEWQPSLSSISEENVVFYDNKGRRRIDDEVVVSPDGLVSVRNYSKRNCTVPSTSTTKARRSSSSRDDNGWTTFQAMPAFSPAPFMF